MRTEEYVVFLSNKNEKGYSLSNYENSKTISEISGIEDVNESQYILCVDLDYFSEKIDDIVHLQQKNKNFDILYLATSPSQNLIKKCYENQIISIVRKPIVTEEFKGVINNFLASNHTSPNIMNDNSHNKFYRLEEEYSPVGVIAEKNNKLLYANKKFSTILQMKEISNTFEFWDRLTDIEFRNVKYHPKHQKFSAIFNHIDNKKIDIDIDEILADFQGEVVKVVLIEDKSEQNEVERNLREQEHYLESLFQFLPVGLVLTDYDTRRIKDLNSTFLKLTHYSTVELIDKKFNECFLNDEGDAIFTNSTEKVIVTKDKKEIYVDILQLVIDFGTKKQIMSVLTDITDKKIAKKNVFEKERLQGVLELAGTINHELNQPLQIIMSRIELLLMFIDENDKNYKSAVKIEEQINRMAEIVSKISKITHYETEDYVGEKRIINLGEASKK